MNSGPASHIDTAVKQRRIMIVDDNDDMRGFLRDLASDYGEVVAEACDGASAAGLYDRQLPDLVLMDIRMPGLDGISAMQEIRDAHPEAHVVMVTDHDLAAYRSAAAEAGAEGYFLKENLRALRDYLRTACSEITAPPFTHRISQSSREGDTHEID